MEKITADFDLLCDTHIVMYELLRKLHFLKLIETLYLVDPLTEEVIGYRMHTEIRKWHEDIIYWLLVNTVDPYGQDVINRLIDRNLITGLSKRDSSRHRGWKVLLWLTCWKSILFGKCEEVDD